MKIPLPSQVAPHGSIVAIARTTLVIALALGIGACQKAAPPEPVKGPELESEVAKASYGLGYNIAGNIENQYGKALDTKAFQTGIDDGFRRNEGKGAGRPGACRVERIERCARRGKRQTRRN
jgi:hypothetical protein